MSIVVCTGGTSHAGRSGVPDNAAATTDRRERPAAARRFAATHPRTASYTQRGVPRRPGAASACVTGLCAAFPLRYVGILGALPAPLAWALSRRPARRAGLAPPPPPRGGIPPPAYGLRLTA